MRQSKQWLNVRHQSQKGVSAVSHWVRLMRKADFQAPRGQGCPGPVLPSWGRVLTTLPSAGNLKQASQDQPGGQRPLHYWLSFSPCFLHSPLALAGYSGATCSFFWVDMGRKLNRSKKKRPAVSSETPAVSCFPWENTRLWEHGPRLRWYQSQEFMPVPGLGSWTMWPTRG